jgi:hypothetical protein
LATTLISTTSTPSAGSAQCGTSTFVSRALLRHASSATVLDVLLERLAAADRQLDADERDAGERDEHPAEPLAPRRHERDGDPTGADERNEHDRDVHEERVGGQTEQLRDLHAGERTDRAGSGDPRAFEDWAKPAGCAPVGRGARARPGGRASATGRGPRW